MAMTTVKARFLWHRLSLCHGSMHTLQWSGFKRQLSITPILPRLNQFWLCQSISLGTDRTVDQFCISRHHAPSKVSVRSTVSASSWPLHDDLCRHRLRRPLVARVDGTEPPSSLLGRMEQPLSQRNTLDPPFSSHRIRRGVCHPPALPLLLEHRRFQSSSSKGESIIPTAAPTSDDSEAAPHVRDGPTDGAAPAVETATATATATAIPKDDVDARARKLAKRRKIKVPQFGMDTTDSILSLQNARKDRARDKTASNVRRALYGNCIICAAKLGAWLSSGSSSMMSEFIHSVVDCGNQALLLMGLRASQNAADKLHPYGKECMDCSKEYRTKQIPAAAVDACLTFCTPCVGPGIVLFVGYGKSVYFWALVSALGTFFLGAGVSMSHAVHELLDPSLSVISNEVWAVLAMSFAVDGYVLAKTVAEIQVERPNGVKFWDYVARIRDPATLAVLLEDGAACLGIVIAIAGIGASHATANPIFDGLAGVGISCLLGGVGLALVRVNHSFLIGQGVEREILDGIESIIKGRRSIENVSSIQSQWTGPETFSFKAEVDFDGTYLSALLMPRYQAEFHKAREDLDEELEVLLSWYAEDVMRAVEREVRHIEAMIRQKYPGAEFIELEPMSKHADQFAIDDSFEEKLLIIEKEELRRLVRVLYETKEGKALKPEIQATSISSDPPSKMANDVGSESRKDF